jgi:hypothetical protein
LLNDGNPVGLTKDLLSKRELNALPQKIFCSFAGSSSQTNIYRKGIIVDYILADAGIFVKSKKISQEKACFEGTIMKIKN